MNCETLLCELTRHEIKYLTVGAVGATLSGYPRSTSDLDILVDLGTENLSKLIDFLALNNYHPRAPVPAIELLDAKKRQTWHDEKNLRAFTFIDAKNPAGNVDLLIYASVEFNEAWQRKQVYDLDGIPVYVAALDDLILLKEDAIKNRNLSKDLYDLEALRQLKERRT